ncbi:hypothetical protein QCA50_009562 [Cerrena zonata]|uniref:Uncharacterized protein n=1 Tax=Cerrena zonata TaxID=2478898 RepID=A0AAW0G6G9_9APHY
MVTNTKCDLTSLEWEMTVNQRGLVDTCFEEGQYETGIGVLDSLRSPRMKPFPPHVRQLVYLALYPPSIPPPEGEVPKNGFELGVPSSPSKLGARHHRSILIPTVPTTIAAQDILMAFAETNSPESLFRALPSYSLSGSESSFGDVQTIPEGDDYDEDSPIARQSRRIKEAKNCWEILKDGFIQPKIDLPVSPRIKGRSRRRIDEDEFDIPLPEHLQIVAAHAWPVLHWIVTILEKDEDVTEREGRARYSPLLLSQIPTSRTAGGRWEVGTPLEIILHCLGQTKEEYLSLGIRLMTLLINLTNCDDLNVNMFMTAACSRLSSLDSSQLAYLLSRLPREPNNVLQFKLVLCRGLLKDPTSGIAANNNSRAKPTVGARPRPLASRRKRADSVAESTASAATATTDGDRKPSATLATATRKFPTTSSSDILRLLATSDLSTSDVLGVLRLKDQLVRTYIIVQISKETKHPGDTACQHDFESGQLIQAIEHTFTIRSRNQDIVGEVEDMKTALLAYVQTAALR